MKQKIAALGEPQRIAVFGEFNYREAAGGRVEIDPNWVRRNIVTCRLPYADSKGHDLTASCHHLAKEPLEAAFAEIAERGLWKLIRSFDGLWMPRHVAWHPCQPLSSHSWGIAFDLNMETNPYGGCPSPENRTLNEVFARYGFAWGGNEDSGRFTHSQKVIVGGMHWELADTSGLFWHSPHRGMENYASERGAFLILAVKRDAGFSYHAVPSAILADGSFEVDSGNIATTCGRCAGTKQLLRLDEALSLIDAKVLQCADHSQDADDPRYYVFVEPA